MDPWLISLVGIDSAPSSAQIVCIRRANRLLFARSVHLIGVWRMISADAFDLKILAALQEEGRLTNQQLAEIVGLSASQCSRRRMRLEEEKVISGYHADLSGEALG